MLDRHDPDFRLLIWQELLGEVLGGKVPPATAVEIEVDPLRCHFPCRPCALGGPFSISGSEGPPEVSGRPGGPPEARFEQLIARSEQKRGWHVTRANAPWYPQSLFGSLGRLTDEEQRVAIAVSMAAVQLSELCIFEQMH
jgi:hypothetical protein